MKRPLLLAVALTLASANIGLATDVGPPARGLEELVEKEGRFAITLVRPGVDLEAYDSLYPWKVTLRVQGGVDEVAEAKPATSSGRNADSGSGFSRDDVAQLEAFLSDALARGLEHGESLRLVKEPDAATLILRVAIVDVTSREAPKSVRRSGHDERLLTAGSLYFDLIDPQSGELVARVGERRRIERVDQPDGSYSATGPWPEAGPWAEQAASDLLQALAEPGTRTSS